jgi:hypothetical protein
VADTPAVCPYKTALLLKQDDCSVSQVIANQEYKPEPKPLTERVPWLIYVVLAVSSIALALVLLSLARTATRLNTQPTDLATKGTKVTK